MSPPDNARREEAIKQVDDGIAANTVHRADSGTPGPRIESKQTPVDNKAHMLTYVTAPVRPPVRGLTALPELNPYSLATPSARQTSFNYRQRVRPEMPHHQSHSSSSRWQSRETVQTAHEQDGQEERVMRVANQPTLNANAPPFTLNSYREVQQPTASVETGCRFNPNAASFDPRQIQPQRQEQSLVRAAQQPLPGYQFRYNMYSSPGHAEWGVPGPPQHREQQMIPADFQFPAVPTGPRHLTHDHHHEQQMVPRGFDFSSLSPNPQQQTSDPTFRPPTGPANEQMREPSRSRHRNTNRHKHHREPKHKIGYPCPDSDPHCHFHHSDLFCHLPWQDCQLARKAIGASFHAHNQWKGAPTGWNEEHDGCVRAGADVGDMCPMHRRIYLDSLQSHERELFQSLDR
ncbi:hypothetical protein BDV97DRAFT_75911 [Delphinella strobiligena]|nr:hypothetical protein BDV97DRAFT_75911 [Delphinella strobiligena]